MLQALFEKQVIPYHHIQTGCNYMTF